MGKDYFKDSSIAPTQYLDHPEMSIWNSFFGAQELNSLAEKQSMDCFTNPFYNCLSNHINHSDSSLSSTITSPAPNDTFFLHKLIENSGTLSQIVDNNLANPRNLVSVSPVFPALVTDQGFIERAAKFSCFSNGNISVSGGNSQENSSVSELVKSSKKYSKNGLFLGELNSRKRKNLCQGNSKEDMVEKDDQIDDAKRSKVREEHWKVHNGCTKEKETKSGNDTSGDDESDQLEKGKQKHPEAPKDYIHVRARRGQATDSHSLAERARREKISERMKLLEDLVPGCNKVTGKALMLDEIINYVQALQHQVEFLSMKLASVDTGMSFDGDSLAPKAIFQPNTLYSSRTQQAPQQLKKYASAVSASQYPMNPLDLSTGLGMPLPTPDRSQISALCEDDLQNIVQMGISHDGQTTNQSLGFSGKDIYQSSYVSSLTNENLGLTAMSS